VTDVVQEQESPLHVKLALIRTAFGSIQKTGENKGTGDGYKFVEASHISERFLALCGEHGVTMLPIDQEIVDIRPTVSGRQVVFTVKGTWRVTDAVSGEFIDVVSFGQGSDNSDKALPKAQTNCMKYGILLVLQRAGDDPEKDEQNDRIEAEDRASAAQARTAARRGRQPAPAPAAPAGQAPFPAEPQGEQAQQEAQEPTQPAAEPVPEAAPAAPEGGVAKASEAKRRAIRARAREVGLTDVTLKAMAAFLVGAKSSKDWTDREADKVLAHLEKSDVVAMFRDDVVAVGEAVQTS
jgi:hypothetical protein